MLEPGGDLVVSVPELAGDVTPATVMLLGPDGRPYRTWGPGHETVAWQPLHGGRFEAWNLNPGTWPIAVAAEDGRTWNGSAVVAAGTVGEATLN